MNYEQRLMAKKRQLEEEIQKKRDLMMIPITESVDELSMYDQHPADLGSAVYEREKDAGLLELYELEMEKLNDAIDKCQKGQYGICEVCGKSIEDERLTKLVNTTLCAECARSQVRENIHPAEYDLINPGRMSDEGETFQVAGYGFFENGDGSSSG